MCGTGIKKEVEICAANLAKKPSAEHQCKEKEKNCEDLWYPPLAPPLE
jgi:hypothetical protein